MDENKIVNLGGSRNENQNNKYEQKSPKHLDEDYVPDEFMDNEFLVPTEEIELPSKGKFYANGQKSIKIKYLTAEDENILTSPELIKNGRVLDVLLSNSIVDKSLNSEEMVTGDRNAVLLALRATGYGDDYEVQMTCPKCTHEYETTVKISSLGHKITKVEPDSSGEFSIALPKMKAEIKFRLLTGKDENYIAKSVEKMKKVKKNIQFSTILTERYLLQIMEFNGNRDKGYIKKAIAAMPISDSLFLREYIKAVEPGVDMETEFQCPSCGEVYNDTTPITLKLFWPNSKV
jgi:transcription elongation factor Elf1